MQGKKTHWLRTTLLVLIVCAVVGTCISTVRFLTDPNLLTYASSRIQLTFDGAASSVAPNGYQFDIKDIFCKDVIDEALKASGLDSRYTVDQIYDQLSIEGDYPADINQQMMKYESILDFNANRTVSLKNYHPTLFTVKLYNEFDKSISKEALEGLLCNITDSAKAYFNKVYSVSIEKDEFAFNLSDYDYTQQMTILSRSLNQTLAYAKSLYNKDPSFNYQGQGFDSIIIRLNNLIENEIDRLNANIFISALSKDDERLLLQYQYEIDNLTVELKTKTECLAKLDKLNESYQKNEIIYLTSGDSWMKIDGNSSETYDKLVAQRKAVADEIATIKSRIDRYTRQMEDLVSNRKAMADLMEQEVQGESTDQGVQTDTETSEEISAIAQISESLDNDIKYITETHEEIKKDFAELIQAYNAVTINDGTVQVTRGNYYTRSLLSTSFISSTFKTAAPLCALGFMICLALIIISRSKEQKVKQ